MNKCLYVKAHPKSSKVQVIEKDAEHFEVWVREAPDHGKANQAVVKAIAKHFDIAPSLVSVKTGLASRNKIIQIAA
jgi:uncharacterized protein YggU (UPF0235/DUF167 family)